MQTKPLSSGLHHDFHDNLYILLRGKKHFTIYPPSVAQYCYMNGIIKQVHGNGRINYEGEETNADGSHIKANNALAASKRLIEATAKLDKV